MVAGRGLIIFSGALGDLICVLPAIRELSRLYPGIGFELMARAELARFAVQRTTIVAGHSIDRREVTSLFSEGGGHLGLVRNFFRQFDRIDSFFGADNDVFCSSLRQAARCEVSFYPFRPPGRGHIAESYLHAIGATVTQPLDDSIKLLPDDLHDAQQKLREFGLKPGRFALILPGSGSAQKNWPAANFAVLAQRIQLIQRVLVVLGPAENGLAPTFHRRSLSVRSDIELGQLAAIARSARCFIGNDSGVSHLSAAAGARGVVFFGPSDPERWHPLGEVKIIRKEPLKDLSLEEVWRPIAELIEADHNRKPG
jgi:heptosyltransferase-3